MSSKKKVAFIHPDLGIGGAERLVLDVATALSKQEKQVFFLTNHFDKSHAFDELKNNEFPVYVFGDWLPRSIFGKFQALCAYIRMVYLTIAYILFVKKKDKPDLYFVDLIPISIPFLHWYGEKVIYYCHHPDLLASTRGNWLKEVYRKPIDWLELKATGMADVILVNSQYTASVFRDTFPEITKPIQVLYPTIAHSYQESLKKLAPRSVHELVEEIPENPNNFVFLSVNRFHPTKRLEMAILAIEELFTKVANYDKIFLIIAGGYDPHSPFNLSYYSKLQQLTNLKKLQKNVIFLKSPSDELKTELLLSCDCVIYTPIKEHFGIVPLEAMAAGKPVIACNSGGPKETVEHGNTGFLCELLPESMADFMKKLLNKELAKEMGQKGKKNLEEKFSYESFSVCLERVFQDIESNKKND